MSTTQEEERNGIEIAVVGMAGRFPDAADLDEFWRNIRDGKESVRFHEPHELREMGVDEAVIADPHYVPAAAELAERDYFDARFFRFAPSEAARLSPQHRVFLETAWHALEDAGIDPARSREKIGLYCGAGMNTYMLHNELHREMTGPNPFPAYFANGHDFLATRTAYKLNLRGPAITVQTACSTSLTAIHLACQSILGGECDVALAGGVAVIPHPRPGYFYMEGGTLSPDGHCRAFDANAKGTIPGSGAGVVVLKSLEDALAAGNPVHAVIRGSAINNDGSEKMGYTAPSAKGQEIVIREAQGMAGVEPSSIQYIETHGTGTILGDPIETAALRNVFPASDTGEAYCALGSVKTNIGHLDAAAGMAGFLKTVLSLRNEIIPPSLNCDQINPELKLEGSPFFVNTAARPWPRGDRPRRAGVSSFGIGGTNAHLILEEAPRVVERDAKVEREKEIIFLSARDEQALDEMSENLAEFIDAHPEITPGQIAQALNQERALFEHRRALVCESIGEAARLLRERTSSRVLTGFSEAKDPPTVFLFPGQGVQYFGMGRDLYRTRPVFRATLDECAEILKPLMGLDIREVLFTSNAADANERLRRTENLQPALFALETAIARSWMSRGLRPSGMLGHSLGEFAAACVSGVFSLTDALTIVTARGRLMGELPPGRMLSVAASERETMEILGEDISIAAVNQDERTTISGSEDEIARAADSLRAKGKDFRELETSHAFHSSMMEPALAPFRKVLESISINEPNIPFISNVTGDWIEPARARDPAYWVEHLRAPVRFASGLKRLGDLGDPLLLECGPGGSLGAFARGSGAFETIIRTLPSAREQGDESAAMFEAEARMRLAGLEFERNVKPSGIRLPLYPFQREYFRLPDAGPETGNSAGGLLHLPTWVREPAPAAAIQSSPVLILADENNTALGNALFAQAQSHETIIAYAAAEFRREEREFHVPFNEEGLASLFAELPFLPARILMLLGDARGEPSPGEMLDAALERYLAGPLALIREVAAMPGDEGRRIVFATSQAFDVLGNEEPRPLAALLQGPVLTAPAEYANLECGLVDMGSGFAQGDSLASSARDLWRELFTPDVRDIIALRGPHRWARSITKISAPMESEIRPRETGAYVITGGTGGIGLEIARELAENSAEAIALISREGENGAYENIKEKVRALRDLGVKILVVRADVQDKASLSSALTNVESELGPIRGVVHAAGIPAGGVIELKTRAAMREILAPRVLGALYLAELMREREPDFMIFCSSVSAISGGFGQCDYAAANAFLDSFANFQARASETKVLAINWDAWSDVGMAARGKSGGENPSTAEEDIGDENFPGWIIRRDEQGIEFAGSLRVTNTWLLEEHRLDDTPLIPGTAYLQAFYMALREFAPGEEYHLEELNFLEPLLVPRGETREMRVELKRTGRDLELTVRSRAPGETHMRLNAQARATTSTQEQNTLLPAEIRERLLDAPHTKTDSPRDFAQSMENSRGIQLGPRWESPREIHYGSAESLAYLTLAPQYAGDLRHFDLHPALLDVAMGFAYLQRDGFYLPLSYRGITVHAPLTPEIISAARVLGESLETLRYEVTITDPDGRLLVQVREFTMRRIDNREALKQNAPRVPNQSSVNPREGLAPALARKAFTLALRLNAAQVIVSTRDPRVPITRTPAAPDASSSSGRPTLRVAYAEPQGETEKTLEKLWSDLLRIKGIGRDDNFFEMGGDSLLAIQIIPGARNAGIMVTPGLIFEHPTIAGLAAAAAKATRDEPQPMETPAKTEPAAEELENALLEVELE